MRHHPRLPRRPRRAARAPSGPSRPLDPPATRREDDADLARRFRATLTWVRDQARIVPIPLGTPNTVDEPYPVPSQTFGWAAGDAAYAMGSYALDEDEALVIEGRSPPCAFWNVCLWNQFLHTYDYAYERVTLNGAQVVYEPDGSWRLVVARRDPGHAELDLDGRPPPGPDLVPVVPPRGHPGPAHHPGGPHRPSPDRSPVRPDRVPGAHRDRRPAPVVLDDLAHPRFSPEIEQLRAGHGRHGRRRARSSPTALCRAAVEQTGHRRLRRRRLPSPPRGAVPGAARGGRTSSASGVVSWYSQLLQFLKNRLLIQDLLTRHPEIHEIEIERPIIICGLPRTGTTHLHNLIGADPALRSLPYWESLEPVLADSERPGPGEPDPRLARTAFALDVLNAALPYFNRMHEMTVDHVHEEIQLLAIDVSTMLFETQALHAVVARLLQVRGPDPLLRVPPHRPEGAAVAAGRRALGAQVPPAPRAVRTARVHVPRRHLRRDPPGPVRR